MIKRRDGKSTDDTAEDPEESWTFIGDENDPVLVKRIHDWDSLAQSGILAQNAGAQGSESSGSRPYGGSDSFSKDDVAS